jgi:hypothetical protein
MVNRSQTRMEKASRYPPQLRQEACSAIVPHQTKTNVMAMPAEKTV